MNGKRFYDHELTKIESLADPQSGVTSGKELTEAKDQQGDLLDDPKAGVTSKKELSDDRDRQGLAMNIVRKHLGVKLT